MRRDFYNLHSYDWRLVADAAGGIEHVDIDREPDLGFPAFPTACLARTPSPASRVPYHLNYGKR
jgi:hypothetical protein